jgi:hypothetical protein
MEEDSKGSRGSQRAVELMMMILRDKAAEAYAKYTPPSSVKA